MKHTTLLVAVCAMLASCHPTGNTDTSPLATRTLDLGGIYRSIEVSHAFHVEMSDTATMPTVTISERLMDKVDIRIEQRELKIGLKTDNTRHIGEATVVLPYNEQLRSVELSGASHFASNRPMGTDLAKVELSGASRYTGDLGGAKVEINLSGASEYTGAVDAGELEFEASGASHATLSGTCRTEFELDLSGASSINARNLDAADVHVEADGASHADLLVCNSLRGVASGASHITYGLVADGCQPAVRVNTTGASTLRQRSL